MIIIGLDLQQFDVSSLPESNEPFNRVSVSGSITLDGQDVYSRDLDPVALRARVGIVFQRPYPFPKSIYDNVAFSSGSVG